MTKLIVELSQGGNVITVRTDDPNTKVYQIENNHGDNEPGNPESFEEWLQRQIGSRDTLKELHQQYLHEKNKPSSDIALETDSASITSETSHVTTVDTDHPPDGGLPPTDEIAADSKPSSKYRIYDPEYHEILAEFLWKRHRNHWLYTNVKLLTGMPYFYHDMDDTPCANIHLDDNWVGLVTLHFKPSLLSENWSSTFDRNGRLEADRTPLGEACLVWADEGQLDIDGNPAPRSGRYFGWYQGLQLLCGEDVDQALYTAPSSSEVPKCNGITFKAEYPAPNTEQEVFLKAKSVKGKPTEAVIYHPRIFTNNTGGKDVPDKFGAYVYLPDY